MRIAWREMAGVQLEPVERHQDERGSFDKLLDGAPDEPLRTNQVCVSFNHRLGTIRGLHLQVPPHQEQKAIWCSSGELFDVLVDTRPGQPSYGCWAAVHLTASRPQMLRIPPGVAHGYQTLTDGSTVNYLIEGEFVAESARTLLWNDSTLGIEWPMDASVVSARDRAGLRWPLS